MDDYVDHGLGSGLSNLTHARILEQYRADMQWLAAATRVVSGPGPRDVLLLDDAGRVLRKLLDMQVAADFLHAGRDGKLRANYPKDTDRLGDLLSGTGSESPLQEVPQSIVLRGKSADVPRAIATRLPPPVFHGAQEQQGLLIRVASGDAAVDARLMRAAFGFSPSEIDVAGHLMSGKSLSEVAQARARAVNTVRAQLRSMYRKTGTRDRGQLIAILRTLTAP